jgi:hypothetical protein
MNSGDLWTNSALLADVAWRSDGANGEFLDNRICQELGGELTDPIGAGRLAELDLEPLALAHAGHLAETQALACPGDGLALRVVDLGLQHHVDNESGHVENSTRAPLRGRATVKFPTGFTVSEYQIRAAES